MTEVIISKCNNSLCFRIPNKIVKSLKLKEGDKLLLEEHKNSFSVIKKINNSVEDVLCYYYGKTIDEIIYMKIVDNEGELDWGNSVGFETIKEC